MKQTTKYYVILVCIYVCCAKSLDRKEGSSCVVDGYNGTCINMYKCYHILQDLAENKQPEICSYDGEEPIVCCTECSEYHVKNISDAVMDAQSGILWKNGKKAWDNCLDFLENNRYPCNDHYSSNLVTYWNDKNQCHDVGLAGVGAAGGQNAQIGELPHMALLGYGDALDTAEWVCGGSVISNKFILTAAHCISSSRLGPVRYAALGILKRTDPQTLWQRYSIKRSVPHPDYRSPAKYHDIALLETETTVQFNSLVLPACLTVEPEVYDQAHAAGWGALGYERPLADVLQKVILVKFSDEECSDIYEPNRHLWHGYNSTTQVCFGDRYNPRDTCEGDSGGPLYKSVGCRFEVIGVTSYGIACGFTGNAGIYTRVEPYVPWIESIVWP